MSKPVVLEDVTGGSVNATHLCVLVHGLWGNPSHLRNVAKSLRDKYSEDELYILLAKQNSGSNTYDGIETGGERVCAEIEDELKEIERKGGKITKLSIAGYSLGGLVSRYAVGLLYAKGVLDHLECMGWLSNIYNVLGARTLSKSGRQLFTIDNFRDTSRPLLALLADPDSIFMSGLKKFKRRTLYTNIANDRSVVHYTSGITKTDPYTDLENVKLNYLKDYDGVILDPNHPVAPSPQAQGQDTLWSDFESVKKWIKNVPFMLTIGVIIPIGVVVFLANSAVQTVRSAKRIKLHESGLAGLKIEDYRMPLRIKAIQEEVEQAYEVLNGAQDQQYLASDSDDDLAYDVEGRQLLRRERRMSTAEQPTLALTPDQFEMIENLNAVGWRKFPVHIQKHRHSHAAIVVRMDKESFADGWVVLRHWADSEFLM
ncbi:hypothetical protein ACHAP8_003590 [Fusarium lateritium]